MPPRSAASGDLHDLDHIPVCQRGGADLPRQQRGLIMLDDDRLAIETEHGKQRPQGERGIEEAFFTIESDLHGLEKKTGSAFKAAGGMKARADGMAAAHEILDSPTALPHGCAAARQP